MKTNHPTSEYKKRHAKIKKLMDNPKTTEEELENEITEDDLDIVHEIARNERLNQLFRELNIDENKLKKAKKQVITLKPKSKKFPLMSTLFRDHNGKYKVEDLINEYHDTILKEGFETGFDYGMKFVAEDIQNGRFTKEDIMNMTDEEIYKYCDENKDEI